MPKTKPPEPTGFGPSPYPYAKEIDKALAVEEARLADVAAVSDAAIAKARDKAMGNVAGIAQDTAQAIIAKLTGKAATAAELATAKG